MLAIYQSTVTQAAQNPEGANTASSPWGHAGVRSRDNQILADACGVGDEITHEDHINHFTAMTGPVPGFVAYFAQIMIDYATREGIAPNVAERAIRQLFLASGTMQNNPPTGALVLGLEAATQKARSIG